MKFSSKKISLIWGILFGLCYHFALPYVTLAHAELVDSYPAPGEVLDSAPEQIILTFNEPVAPGSTFVIYDRDFAAIPATIQTDANHPDVVSAHQIEIAESGIYTIQWIAIGGDGHSIDGTFAFAVDLSDQPTKNTNEENNMELIAAAENASINLPGWFAWIMVALAIVVPILVYNLTRTK
ncbi:MAG: copper transport protein [Cellvibrionaceae bacterium]|jgi:copper transport protein